MDSFSVIKTLHILSSTILFGTGMGIAFFMLASHRATTLQEKYCLARLTVLADFVFTTPAVLLQPLTGFCLIYEAGYDPMALWLRWTYGLYLLTGLCWLPVVWIQIQMKKILGDCLATGASLPARYHALFRVWFLLGWPAFLSLIVIFYLMVTKPYV